MNFAAKDVKWNANEIQWFEIFEWKRKFKKRKLNSFHIWPCEEKKTCSSNLHLNMLRNNNLSEMHKKKWRPGRERDWWPDGERETDGLDDQKCQIMTAWSHYGETLLCMLIIHTNNSLKIFN